MTDHDDDDTPPDRDPTEPGKRRVRTSAQGVPVVMIDEAQELSRRIVEAIEPRAADDGASKPTLTIKERLAVLESRATVADRRAVKLKRWLQVVAGGAITSLGTVVIWALSTRDATVVERERIRQLIEEVQMLRAYLFPPPARRGEPPDYPSRAPRLDPAPPKDHLP